MKLKNNEDQSLDASVLLRRGNKLLRRKYEDKVWSRDRKIGHPETVPPGDSSNSCFFLSSYLLIYEIMYYLTKVLLLPICHHENIYVKMLSVASINILRINFSTIYL